MRRSERKLLNFSVLESTSSIIFGGTQRTAEFWRRWATWPVKRWKSQVYTFTAFVSDRANAVTADEHANQKKLKTGLC